MEGLPEDIKQKHLTAFGINYEFIINAAARRQKWIDQSQSVNLFLEDPDMKTLSHMYRHAWHTGLKTTYYLRTHSASNIEKSNVGQKSPTKSQPSPAEIKACSIKAMQNGEECEACQ